MGLFDTRPKNTRKDLYDRENELKLFREGIRNCRPIILLLGSRRTGKTSLLFVGLNEYGDIYSVIDCRAFEEKVNITYREFIEIFTKSLSMLIRKAEGISRYFSRIRGIKVAGFEIEFKNSPNNVYLIDVFEKLNEWGEENNKCIVIAFDEAQELSKLRGVRFLPLLAYIYDNLRHISLILTGSQIGLLYRFLKRYDPSSPLYGRAMLEVRLDKFTYEQSLDFLIKGFEEYNVKPDMRILEYAVDVFNGIPGWLTLFGYRGLNEELKSRLVEEVLEEASKLAISEYRNFLSLRPIAAKRYTTILYAIAEGYNTWSSIKRYLEIKEDKRISDYLYTNLIKNLVDAGFIERMEDKYIILDPVLKHAFHRKLIH
ncbi:MAG: ATP-binding protein [Candidatus Methanomethylicia archaeon]